MMLRCRTPHQLIRAMIWTSRLLILLGLAGTAAYLWSEADRHLYEHATLAALEEEIPPLPPAIVTPPAPPLAGEPKPLAPKAITPPSAPLIDPRVLGQIEIPRLAVKAIVRRGIDSGTLRRSVGHVPGTALPGQSGNSVLAAHRDTFFAPLRGIASGDLIRIRLRSGQSVDYRVDSLAIVGRDAVDVMGPASAPRLTLITCYPFDYIGPSPRRFIVGAALAALPVF